MKYIAITIISLLLLAGCVKPPDEFAPSFWDPNTEVLGLGKVLDSTYVLNNENERVYTLHFKIFWDQIPIQREDAILSVAVYNNGRNIPLQYNAANRTEYRVIFFAPPQATTCLTFGFITSTGGFTRQFDLACVDVP